VGKHPPAVFFLIMLFNYVQCNIKHRYNNYFVTIKSNSESQLIVQMNIVLSVIVLMTQQLADRHAAPLGHIIQIPSQPVFLLNVACLADNQQISIL
jgi:hypothetical protein